MNKQRYLDQFIYPNWDKNKIIPPGIDSSFSIEDYYWSFTRERLYKIK